MVDAIAAARLFLGQSSLFLRWTKGSRTDSDSEGHTSLRRYGLCGGGAATPAPLGDTFLGQRKRFNV